MSKSLLLRVALICASVHASAARADEADIKPTVHCMIVGFSMLQVQDADQQRNGLIVAMYLFGKLDGLAPKADLQDLIAKESAALTPEVMTTEAVRCGRELIQRGEVMQLIGKNLEAKPAAAPDASPSPATDPPK